MKSKAILVKSKPTFLTELSSLHAAEVATKLANEKELVGIRVAISGVSLNQAKFDVEYDTDNSSLIHIDDLLKDA
ncbi:unnamed protein product [Sphenostylis stenocarpa]|uniref:Uncharacterized protein n=1 Tax=Sphenostylis stenocarpa TaxID=92480 RepID=A0AA86SME7_9FABA|nr:unnamed protein product [Sphenostylis stenocarpa]